MRRIVKTTIACLLILLRVDAIATAQNAQETTPANNPCANEKERATPNEPCISVSYDRFKGQTSIILAPFTLYTHGMMGSFSFGVTFSSASQVIERPEKAYFVFKYFSLSIEPADALERRSDVDFLVDGVPHALGKVTLVSDEIKADVIRRAYGVPVSFKTIELIASGKSVEMRAGSFEYTFTEAVKRAFRKLLELAPVKASTEVKKPTQPQTPAKKPTPSKPKTNRKT